MCRFAVFHSLSYKTGGLMWGIIPYVRLLQIIKCSLIRRNVSWQQKIYILFISYFAIFGVILMHPIRNVNVSFIKMQSSSENRQRKFITHTHRMSFNFLALFIGIYTNKIYSFLSVTFNVQVLFYERVSKNFVLKRTGK